jgi:hypothetical protein
VRLNVYVFVYFLSWRARMFVCNAALLFWSLGVCSNNMCVLLSLVASSSAQSPFVYEREGVLFFSADGQTLLLCMVCVCTCWISAPSKGLLRKSFARAPFTYRFSSIRDVKIRQYVWSIPMDSLFVF